MSKKENSTNWFKFSIGDNFAIINIDNIANISAYQKANIKRMIDNKIEVNGLIDSLGEPIPVLDLNKYINISDDEYSSPNKMILIVKIKDKETNLIKRLGLKTDEIIETITLNNNINFFNQDSTVLFHKFFHEIIKIEDEFIYKFDVEELFNEIPRQWEEI